MSDSYHLLDVTAPGRWVARAAEVLATAVDHSIERRGRCLLGISGGSTPTPVFAELATHDLDWTAVTIVQVDERIVPLDSSSRNLMVQRGLLGHLECRWLPLPVDELLTLRGRPPIDQDQPRPVEGEAAEEILRAFSRRLVDLAADPPILDVVHLGLGSDGHTASLVPGDPIVDELRRYVGLTGLYSGSPPTSTQAATALDKASLRPTTQRVSLTRPVLDRARMAFWLVQGADKAESVQRLYRSDRSIPAGLIRPAHSVIVADSDAAAFIA
ncbi:MAG: 6-phosphogluconolactonase [Acidimicrobiia bacterium]|nr:6-phosphogluconolactonase [Acidimicrobiia bacterium]